MRNPVWRALAVAFSGRLALQLDVVLQAHALDHLELGLEEIDVLFLTFEDALEDLAAGEVAHALAVLDRVLEQRDRFHLQRQVGLEDFLDRFADFELVQRLEVGQPLEEQDAVGRCRTRPEVRLRR